MGEPLRRLVSRQHRFVVAHEHVVGARTTGVARRKLEVAGRARTTGEARRHKREVAGRARTTGEARRRKREVAGRARTAGDARRKLAAHQRLGGIEWRGGEKNYRRTNQSPPPCCSTTHRAQQGGDVGDWITKHAAGEDVTARAHPER